MNITEFSKIAGVSKSAVSRYFNNGYLSGDKRILIEKALEKTGYNPNPQAQNIRTRVTKLVGVILPKLSSESCSRVVEGLSEVLDEEGYQILLVNTNNNAEKEIEYLDLFKSNRVDGVILLATYFTEKHKKILSRMKIPVIIVGQEYRGYNCVCHDDFGAAYALTKLMIAKGCKKPLYIGVSEEDKAAGLARKEGFLKALDEKRIQISDNMITISKFNSESGYIKMQSILNKGLVPDCVFCATDSIALGAMSCILENGMSIPKDIVITSVGDSKAGKLAASPLTTAHLHYKTSGIEAANLFLALLNKNNSIPKTLKLDYEIKERKSTNGK